VHIDYHQDLVYLFECKSDLAKCGMPEQYPLDEVCDKFDKQEYFIIEDKFFNTGEFEELSQREKNLVVNAYGIIRDIVASKNCYSPDLRWKLIKKKLKFASKKVIYRHLKKYWRNGMCLMALAPAFANCGAPKQKRKSSITEDNQRKIIAHYKDYILRKNYTVRVAYSHFLDANVELKGIISESKYYRIGVNSTTKTKRKKAKNGERDFENNFRVLTGRSIDDIPGPCYLYQIDETTRDIKILSSYVKGQEIGRSTFYIITDVWSRAIVGILITLDNPSFDTASQALLYAFTDKRILYKRLGLEDYELGWSSCFLPKEIVADKAEFFGPKSEMIVKNFNLRLGNTVGYRPIQKGNVEILIDIVQERVVHLFRGNGQVYKQGEVKTSKDSSLEAKIILEDLIKITLITVDEYNNKHWIEDYPLSEEMINDLVKPIPAELHKWGIKEGLGEEKVIDEKVLWLKFLGSKMLRPDKDGFRLNRQDYVVKDEKYKPLYQEVYLGKKKQEIRFDQRNYKKIFWVYKNEFIELRLRGKKDCQFKNEWDAKHTNLTYNELKKEQQALEDEVRTKNDSLFKSMIQDSQSTIRNQIKNSKQAKSIERELNHKNLNLLPNDLDESIDNKVEENNQQIIKEKEVGRKTIEDKLREINF